MKISGILFYVLLFSIGFSVLILNDAEGDVILNANPSITYTDTTVTLEDSTISPIAVQKTWRSGKGDTHITDSTTTQVTFSNYFEGIYTPELEYKLADDSRTSGTTSLVIVKLPIMAFEIETLNPKEGRDTKFKNNTIDSGELSWNWDFGETGKTSTEKNPTIIYSTGESKTVTLKSLGYQGREFTKVDDVYIGWRAPIANIELDPPISGNSKICEGRTGYTPFLRQISPSGERIDTLEWKVDGVSLHPERNNLYETAYSTEAAGDYAVSLTATGPGGESTDSALIRAFDIRNITTPYGPTINVGASRPIKKIQDAVNACDPATVTLILLDPGFYKVPDGDSAFSRKNIILSGPYALGNLKNINWVKPTMDTAAYLEGPFAFGDATLGLTSGGILETYDLIYIGGVVAVGVANVKFLNCYYEHLARGGSIRLVDNVTTTTIKSCRFLIYEDSVGVKINPGANPGDDFSGIHISDCIFIEDYLGWNQPSYAIEAENSTVRLEPGNIFQTDGVIKVTDSTGEQWSHSERFNEFSPDGVPAETIEEISAMHNVNGMSGGSSGSMYNPKIGAELHSAGSEEKFTIGLHEFNVTGWKRNQTQTRVNDWILCK